MDKTDRERGGCGLERILRSPLSAPRRNPAAPLLFWRYMTREESLFFVVIVGFLTAGTFVAFLVNL